MLFPRYSRQSRYAIRIYDLGLRKTEPKYISTYYRVETVNLATWIHFVANLVKCGWILDIYTAFGTSLNA